MTSITRISTLLISLLLLVSSGAADEKRARLRRQVVALGEADASKNSRGEFLESLWNVDGARPVRQLGVGGHSKSGKKSNNGKKNSSNKKHHESYDMSMSMSMSFDFYF